MSYCPAGSYYQAKNRILGLAAGCYQCPYGFVNPTPFLTGVASCLQCNGPTQGSGQTTTIRGASDFSQCVFCKPGTYLTSTNMNGTSDRTCTSCPPGTYSDTGAVSCTSCPAGSYSDVPGSATCTSCPPGMYSQAVGATSNVCVSCPVGYYSNVSGSSACGQCPAGSYSDAPGSAACTSCSPGTYSAVGSAACASSCPSGTLRIVGSRCLNDGCPAGKYFNGSTCNSCPTGTFYVGPGAKSVSECTPCVAGTYSTLGSPVCTKCPPGTSLTGSECTPCSAGTYSSSFGSTSCSTCPPDSYSYEGLGFCFRAYAGSGLIEDRGLYITHTFPSGSFSLIPFSSNVVVYDFISITATQIYSSPGVFTISQTTPITVSASSTPTIAGKVPILNPGTTLVTDYGTFNAGTPQLVVVYLKDPCPSGTFWNPLKKQCVPACTTPFTTSQNGVCVKCTSRTMALVAPLVCETGFTLSGTTCTGTENKCPDPSWTLSGTTCTKTDESCPPGYGLTARGYCLSPTDGSSSLTVSTTLTQAAVATQVTKPAFGSVCTATCPVNTYMSNGDCVQCPSGQLSPAGSTSISACQCPAGTFGTNGSGVCTSCGTDQTSPQGTQTQSGCVMYCPAGKYASGSSCMPCPYGTSLAGSTSVSACACSQGTFLSGGSCVTQCPAGMYSNTVTGSCTSCPGNQTSTVGATGVAGCACPDGTGGINGTGLCSQCTGGQTSTATNVTCPDTTWTLTGSICSKVSSYDCPNGTDYRTANTCYYTTFTYPSTGCTLKNFTCPSGWTVNGSVCLKTGQPMTAATVTVSCPIATSYTCPSGYTLSGTTCTSNTPLYYSCQSGGSSMNTTGAGVTTVTSNWVLEGTRCKRYTCSASTPSGSSLIINGSSCRLYNSLSGGTCPTGYDLMTDMTSNYVYSLGLKICSKLVLGTDATGAYAEFHLDRQNPGPQTITTTVASGDDTLATAVNDTIPATHPMADQVVTGTLTRSEAQVISIQTTNATTGTNQGRQCSCLSGQFWNFVTKECTTQCPVATYADTASKTCQPCPANKTSVAGSTSVSQCVCSYASPYWSGTSCMQQLNPTAAVTVSGSGITTRYVNKYVVHEFTQAASFVVNSPIIANILLVGGGAGGSDDGKPGNGGAVTTSSNYSFNTGTYNIAIGTGGAPNTVGGCTTLR